MQSQQFTLSLIITPGYTQAAVTWTSQSTNHFQFISTSRFNVRLSDPFRKHNISISRAPHLFLGTIARVSDQRCSGCCEQFLCRKRTQRVWVVENDQWMPPCYNNCLKLSRRPALNIYTESLDLLWCYSESPPNIFSWIDRLRFQASVDFPYATYKQLTLVETTRRNLVQWAQTYATSCHRCCLQNQQLLLLLLSLLLRIIAIGNGCLLLPTSTLDDHTPNYCWLCQMTSVRIDNCKTFMVIALPKHGCFSPQSPSQPPQLSERNTSKHRDTDRGWFLWINPCRREFKTSIYSSTLLTLLLLSLSIIFEPIDLCIVLPFSYLAVSFPNGSCRMLS